MRRGLSAAALAGALALAAGASGCGLGPGRATGGASLVVTRDFGRTTVGRATARRIAGSDTVMRFLARSFRVQTRYGGGFVQSIDGLAGSARGARRIDWFYYVNGIEAGRGASATRLHPGDRVWWDRHDWAAAMSIPAVVGSFPEPFRSGSAGRRLPVTLGCSAAAARACDDVARALAGVGVPAGRSSVGVGSSRHTLRVLVGPWASLRSDPMARRLEQGPQVSGVFARPVLGGRGLALLDAGGAVKRELSGGAGLIAATGGADQQPTWLVTGTDVGGVLAAARAFDQRHLQRRFALALGGGRSIALPVGSGR